MMTRFLEQKHMLPGTPFSITPDDNADQVGRAIVVGTVGDLVLETFEGDQVTIPSNCLAAGQMYPYAFRKVLATGTTASEIIGIKKDI